MGKKEVKTNAMRILDRMKISYEHREYECDEFTDGSDVASKLGLPHEKVFKTLVTEGNDRQHYVFVIPVDKELDLKACARAVGVKAVQMIHMKELLPETGYIRGGCSPIGMKKPLPTYIYESALLYDYIYVSAGMRGLQIKIAPKDLIDFIGADIYPI